MAFWGGVLAAVVAACGGSGEGQAPAGTTASAASGGGIGGAGGAASSGVGGVDLSTSLSSSGTGAAVGCKAVDFLFVIDSSVSMKPEQESLIASFPGFMSAIEANLASMGNYHIMVVDTDAGGKCNPDESGCKSKPVCNEANEYACTASLTECDTVLGAGVVHPIGNGATNAVCKLAGDKRYIQPGEPSLGDAFACTASVGLAGLAAERPMNAMQAALSPELLKAGGCNEGFLRDEAVLVITVITDEPGQDTGTPEEWKASVLAAKKLTADESDAFTEKKIVVIGFTRQTGSIPKFIDMWAEGQTFRGDHNDANYSPLFEQAIKGIEKACEEIVK